MTLDIEPVLDQKNLKPSLTVMGVGGAGSNAVNNMIQSNLNNVEFIVANTDAQALENSLCYNRIQLGLEKTKGLGACLLYTSPSPRDMRRSRMPSSA